MAEFDKERVIARHTDLMSLMRVGAYQERLTEEMQETPNYLMYNRGS